ncbi:MAG: threonylcarbamoyl-AMP synthase [Fibrobacteres bacterium]|nr:threonylcarbamoyl-AMP synthase [Fibrobacterota bacterium]
MRVLQIHPVNPQDRLIQQAVQVLENGGVIVYPSDTSYALAANIFEKKAVERLYSIKKSAKSQLFSCICYDFSKISEYAFVSTQAYRVMNHLLPGPYTFILRGKTSLPKITMTKRKTIGVRMPDYPIAKALYEKCGIPFLSTGIRLDDGEVLNDPESIKNKIGHAVDLIIDGGEIPYSPSSIISLEEDVPSIIREGSGDLSFFQ